MLNIPCDILYYQHINIYAFLCVETKALAITHLILYYLIIFPYSLHTVSFIAYILEFKTNKYLINNVYINLFFFVFVCSYQISELEKHLSLLATGLSAAV